ncbi:hypothetical protein GWK41_02775 [Persephonella atlantica]|uniref:Uncharacterized protein n=1 Tax=Persephonella atlantica TaxID=2699429 RepID=A0ABS1GGE0_9AQUI|nr:hypothetical protein [Persephonella atlantica]MBK3331990.1 hypothetical protein [Persephonella atlantica]
MGTLKNLLRENDLDSRVFQIIKEIVGSEEFCKLKEFLYFYKISATIEGDYLIIKQFFHAENKWLEIARFNFRLNKVEEHIGKSKLLKYLKEENRYINESVEKEIKRTSSIILALLSLVLGVLTALLVLNLIK